MIRCGTDRRPGARHPGGAPTRHPRLRPRLARRAVAALLVAGAVLPAIGLASPTPAAAATKARVTLVGDSTMLAMNEGDKDVVRAKYDLLWDAASCRRLLEPSCRGRGTIPQSVIPLIRTTHRGQLGEALVVMAAYDDWRITTAMHELMAEARTQGVARVVFLTLRENVSYTGPNGVSNAETFRRHNAELRSLAAQYPSLQLADWNAHSAARPEWFASDGIHLTPAGSRALANFIVTDLQGRGVGRCTNAATGAPSAAPTAGPIQTGPTHSFQSRQPVRVLDTREAALGGAGGMLGAGRAMPITLGSSIPGDASAMVATVTAVDPCLDGFLTVYPGPCASSPPLAASVNFVTGRITANTSITALGAGQVCIYSSVATDVVVDVQGWVGPTGSKFNPITPQRFVDTRDGAGVVSTIVGRRVDQQETQIPVAGRGNVPAGATAVMANITSVQSDVAGYVSLYPGPCNGSAGTSTVNTMGRRDTGAATIVGLGPDGSVCARNSMATDLVLDVQGWFGDSGLQYRPQTPQRVLDTRETGASAPTAPSAIPSTTPVLLNVVADRPTGPGFLWAAGCAESTDTAILNLAPREITGNVVAVAPSGNPSAVCIGASWPTHVVADLSGVFL